MKKIIELIFILLITLMILGGCTSTSVEPKQQNQQKVNPEPEQNQQSLENPNTELPQNEPKDDPLESESTTDQSNVNIKECMLTRSDNLKVGIGKLCTSVKDCEGVAVHFDDIKDNFPELICEQSEFMAFPAGCQADEDCYPGNSEADQILKRHEGYKETIKCSKGGCWWTKGVAKLTGRLNINKP